MKFDAQGRRVLDADTWSAMVDGWNNLNSYMHRRHAEECRLNGHDFVVSPVGPMCKHCFIYRRAS